MSSAINHRKRSHRSAYKTRGFNGSRRSVEAVSLTRKQKLNVMHMLRKFFTRKGNKDGQSV